jgi:hypothetical protein
MSPHGVVTMLVAGLSAGVVACSSPVQAVPAPGSAVPAPVPSAPAPRAYRNAQWGYSFDPPPGWISVPDKGPESPYSERFLGPPRPVSPEFESEPELRIANFRADGLDLKGMVEHAKDPKRHRLAGKGYRLLIDEDLTLADGRPAHLLGAVKQILGYDMRELKLIVVERGQVYVLETTSPEFTFARDEPTLRASLTSFTLG